mgnify:CR=1 FL=1
MTEDTLRTILDGNGSSGEKWASVQQFVAEAVDIPTKACSDAVSALERCVQAIDKAKLALESKNQEAASEALAAITAAKKTDAERRVAEIDAAIADLQVKKEELLGQ